MADAHAVVPVRRTDDLEAKWIERERALLSSVDGSIRYYTRCARRARIWHRVVGIVILICVVLAPVAVVSGGKGGGLVSLRIPEEAVTAIAVLSTLLVAFAEGLRRTFQFDQRWTTCIKAREELWRLKDTYLDEQVPNPVGTDNWIAKLFEFRKREQDIRIQEESGFFELLKAGRESETRSK
jgi:Protein of unknown function (DUF4231)